MYWQATVVVVTGSDEEQQHCWMYICEFTLASRTWPELVNALSFLGRHGGHGYRNGLPVYMLECELTRAGIEPRRRGERTARRAHVCAICKLKSTVHMHAGGATCFTCVSVHEHELAAFAWRQRTAATGFGLREASRGCHVRVEDLYTSIILNLL